MDNLFYDLQPGWKELIQKTWEKHKDHIEPILSNEESIFEGVLDILPPKKDVFRAFCMFPLEELKVCIIGQDPYHNKGEANGLCFSVSRGCRMPPSLRNVFKELEDCYGQFRVDTDLSDWAKQGVLLLNTALTVREGGPGSHAKIWKEFTKDIVCHIGTHCKNVVFLLWGAHAQSFEDCIDPNKHYVLKHSHPSPLARKPFVGNKHFLLANAYLQKERNVKIQWMG